MVSMDKAFARKQAASRGADLKLFIRNVRDKQGRKRPITVRTWSTIKDVKDLIQQSMDIPARSQRLFFGPLMTSGKELPNHRSLHDVGIDSSGQTILLDIKDATAFPAPASAALAQKEGERSDVVISSSVIDAAPKPLKQLVQSARRALALGLKPEFILEGSGGTYFLHDPRKVKIAVFKPADEEPYAENNPRGYLQQAGQYVFLREGVVPGEACIREVAAFMMDHSGFSGVPMTTLVEARHPTFNTNGARLTVAEGGASIGAHSIARNSRSSSALAKKVGSFQEFIRCECSMDDISPSKISVDQVHRIAILDIRLMNADRNSANLLCRRRPDNSIELVPIDHGFCLRSVADVSWMDWCWLDWPQLKQVRCASL
jgi:Phosphatidylinositol 3- and 4-kinase/Ubiquitin family